MRMKPLPCPPSDWPRFSSLLDAYLELGPEARAAWLDRLPENEVRFKPLLQALLSTGERRSGDWLDRPAEASEAASPYVEGMRFGPWRLLKPLGSGGMGTVWLAARADGAYEREVALKLPHSHLLAGAQRERFQRERDILAALTDPRIARFYDAGIGEGEQPWLALEYVPGTPISDYCQRGALTTRERVALVREVAAAVQAAHARLIVHRDLKPANVLVTAAGEVKLLDFGIAKLIDHDSEDSGLTQFGGRAATPDYAAPEQLTGAAVTVATDVYALGGMLYELLAGQRPFPTRSRLGRMIEERGEAPLASSRASGKRRAELIGDLDAILAKAMALDPSRRYASADAFSEELGRYLAHQPIQAQRIGHWRRSLKFIRRHRQGAAVACLLLAALGAGIVGVLWQAQRAAEQARRASAITDFLVEVFAASDPRIASDRPRGSITAKALLDAGAAKIESRFADDPDVQIELLRTMADLYAQLGEDERYETLQALQLKKVRERYGPLHPNILNAAVETSSRACASGDTRRCEASLDEAGRLLSAAGDEDPELRAYWWINRGLYLQRQDGRIDEARSAFERAVALFRQHAPRSRGYVTALHELAGFLNAQEQQARAIATYQQALTLAESLPDRNDAELQTLYGNLGLIHQQLGQFAEAAHAFQASAEIADRTTGAEFPTAWVPRANAARTLHLIGRRELARREFERLLPLLPDDDRYPLETATVRMHYGERMTSEGQPAVGIPALEAAERIYAQQSAFSFQLRLTRRFLGEAYARAGRRDAAGRMLKASLDEYVAHQQDRDQPVMAIRESWGRWLLDNDLTNEAQAQFKTIVDHADGRALAHIALAHGGLARAALVSGDLTVARRESAAALDAWTHVTGFRDIRMGPYLRRIRADVLAAGGETAAAQSLENEAAAASARYDHPDSPTVVRRRMTALR
jgi:serine/threonine-protein kinase